MSTEKGLVTIILPDGREIQTASVAFVALDILENGKKPEDSDSTRAVVGNLSLGRLIGMKEAFDDMFDHVLEDLIKSSLGIDISEEPEPVQATESNPQEQFEKLMEELRDELVQSQKE